VEVVVLDVNKATKRISLGMKQIEGDPWSSIDDRIVIGQGVQGEVRKLTDVGAFVELEPGIDGLLHISDMSWTRNIGHPSELLKKGQPVETQILNVDRDNKRISLGLKQIQPDPWETVSQRYPMGSRVTGKVVRLTDFGAFVELEPGVDGLLHISQMSNRPIASPADLVNVGDELTLLVIRVDPNERRIGLSLKELAAAVMMDAPPQAGGSGSGRTTTSTTRTSRGWPLGRAACSWVRASPRCSSWSSSSRSGSSWPCSRTARCPAGPASRSSRSRASSSTATTSYVSCWTTPRTLR